MAFAPGGLDESGEDRAQRDTERDTDDPVD
jgi:hypothetical protein